MRYQLYRKLIPDTIMIKHIYKKEYGRRINLRKPHTFNEKIQWIKLYDRNPLYPQLVDKNSVKHHVANIIGEEYVIPTLGVWNRFEEIDFDSLPNQFVLKCTHDSGGVVICKDKSKLNMDFTKQILESSLEQNFYWYAREWAYKSIKPRIVAEKYMEDKETEELRDYKFFTFNGIAKIMFVASERQSEEQETRFDFFDMEYNHLPIINMHPNADISPKRPESFDEMRLLAEKLSKGIPHVRVDFYEVNGKPYFGEYTFYHYGGFSHFEPEEWDVTLGSWIDLP